MSSAPGPASASGPSPRAAGVSLALLALSVFVGELALMRAVAQATWPPFAFLAVSAAMLGGGIAGTVLAVRPKLALSPLTPALGALLVGVGAPASVLAALTAGLEPTQVGAQAGGTVLFAVVLLVMALPFAGLGLSLSALLEQVEGRPQRLYGADLVGAAVGAALSIAALDALGVVGAAALAGAGGAAATLMLTSNRVLRALAAVAVVAGLAGGVAQPNVIPQATAQKTVRSARGAVPVSGVLAKLQDAGRLLTEDRADGRIDVVPARPAPRFLLDLGAAVTRVPEYPFRGPPPKDAAAAAFVARSPRGGRTLVVGSGGGYEVARALAYGADHVDAVEVSAGVVTLVTSGAVKEAKRVFSNPKVELHHDEARAFLERSDRRYRHIVAVHTISNAALSAGAMRLAEDFVLTVEGVSAFYAHLEDDGLLYFTRPLNQIGALADVAREALRRAGVAEGDVDKHLALLAPSGARDPFFRGLFVSRTPIEALLDLPPGIERAPLPAPRLARLPTDDHPFFHRLADRISDSDPQRLQIEAPAMAERSLLAVGLASMLTAVLAVLAPLLARRRREESEPPMQFPLLATAAILGLAFMLAELAFAQRLTLVCGRPLVAFATVVGGMLVGAGGGALFAGNRPLAPRRVLLLAVTGTALLAVVPPVLTALGALAWPAPVRLAMTALVAALGALPLGLPFPALVEEARRHHSVASAPWLYGVNAVTGVGASAVFAALGPAVGLSGVAWSAAGLYAVGAALCWRTGGKATS